MTILRAAFSTLVGIMLATLVLAASQSTTSALPRFHQAAGQDGAVFTDDVTWGG